MTKAEAKREACGIVASQITAGADRFIEQSGRDFSDADHERLMIAFNEIANEFWRRSRDH